MNKIKSFLLIGDKKFYTLLFSLAIPICLQNLITSSLNMCDTLMVGRLGEIEIASVGVINQIFFLFNFILIGITGGCGIYISQFFGNKNTKGIKHTLSISLFLTLIVSIIFTLVGSFFPENIIAIFNNDTELIKCGSSYFKIVCLSYLFTAATITFSTACKNIGNAFLPMIVSFISVITNIVLNYILIFGKFGAPELGIEGAAIATLFARILEILLLYSYLYIKKSILLLNLSSFKTLDSSLVSRVSKTVLDTTLIEIAWATGVVMYSVAYGKIGTDALASIQIYTTVQNFFLIIVYGVSNSSSVIIAQEIGAGNDKLAAKYGRTFTTIGGILGVILSILMVLTAKPIVSLFNISETLKHDTILLLIIGAISFVGFVVNTILIVGIFRGGGDTKYPLAIESFTIWCIGVPIAFLGALVFKLPIYLVVLLVGLEEATKTIFTLKRLFSDKWVKNVIQNVE